MKILKIEKNSRIIYSINEEIIHVRLRLLKTWIVSFRVQKSI